MQQEAAPPVDLPGTVGIDLGLKDLAVDSEGWRVKAPRLGRKTEAKLARLQRPRGTGKAGKRSRKSKALTRAHRKLARRRRHLTHVASKKTVLRAFTQATCYPTSAG